MRQCGRKYFLSAYRPRSSTIRYRELCLRSKIGLSHESTDESYVGPRQLLSFFLGYSRRNSLSSQFLLHSLVLKKFSFLLFPFSISIIRSLEFCLIILLAHSRKPSLFYQFSVTVDGKHFMEIVFQVTLSWTSQTKFSKNVCNCC